MNNHGILAVEYVVVAIAERQTIFFFSF